MGIDFNTESFKGFENVQGLDAWQRAVLFSNYLDFLRRNGGLNYRMVSSSGCGPQMQIITAGQKNARTYISFVSNDYLGFTQHPGVKEAVIAAVMQYGSGAGASPAIGAQFSYHEELKKRSPLFSKEKARSWISKKILSNQ